MIKSASQSSISNNLKYRSMSAGAVPSSEYLIQTTVVGATPAASIEFDVSDYAGIYRHLKVVWTARTSSTADIDDMIILNFNSDSGSNYSTTWLRGTGSADTENASFSSSYIWGGWAASALASSNIFGSSTIDIYEPYNTNKNITTRAMTGVNGFGIGLLSGLWMNTTSLTTITLAGNVGSFVQGSRFSLYGVTS